VPVLGNTRSLNDALTLADAGAVFVTDTEHLGPNGLKDLTWNLQATGVDLMVSPNVVDVATPRITLRSVGAMPFLHLEKPQYEGATRWGKVVFDRTFATLALLLLSPVLLAAALAVKLTSSGPVLYRSERIGVGGVPFEMLKFRSMVNDADEVKAQLESDSDGVLFKMKNDPRVTKVGALLRRYSIDELPQLLNVLRGDMSIVGPRPPLRSEVEQYGEGVHRRLLVKQGITGLWQVSGRSDLSWEDAVRLDLDYVENWSLVRDIQIIWRTVKAVLLSDGAY
jgi:exopolysaccharide biosynthesis polyprenyl glycosylphosphotransferase